MDAIQERIKENMKIYNAYKSVPKEALKAFDNGKFKGTDINTMWRIKCLTELLGPCGVGWKIEIKRCWSESSGDTTMAFAQITLHIKVNDNWDGFDAVGGNRLAYVSNAGKKMVSDEAYKMAVTDAFGVACKYLGIGADVYWENDRTKYSEDSIYNISDEVRVQLDACGITDLEKLRRYYKVKVLTDAECMKAIELWREQNGQA